jgi:hypothetical protein
MTVLEIIQYSTLTLFCLGIVIWAEKARQK